jgi:hypothetical protein
VSDRRENKPSAPAAPAAPAAPLDRRTLLSLGLGAAALVASRRAAAAPPVKPAMTTGDWLVRAAILLDETKRAQDWVGAHPSDTDLAALVLEIAEARSTAAARIPAPAAVKNAHMSLLLVLENTTASLDASARGDWKKAAQRMSAARTEERTLNTALEAAKLKIPSLR